MEIFRIAAIALVTAFCVILLRNVKSELAAAVGLAGGIIVEIGRASCRERVSINV